MRKPKLERRPASSALRRVELTDAEIRAACDALWYVLKEATNRNACVGSDDDKVSALAALRWSVNGRR
jgi:hypothetical protein